MDGFLFVKNLRMLEKLVILPMLKRRSMGKMFHVKHMLINVKKFHRNKRIEYLCSVELKKEII